MNKKSLIALAITSLAWIASASGQTTFDNMCQFYQIQQSVIIQYTLDGMTAYNKNSIQAMWPVMLNGKDCISLQRALIEEVTGKDDISDINQAINYFLYTDMEGNKHNLGKDCKLVDEASLNGQSVNISTRIIKLQDINSRFATFHIFYNDYYAGAAHGLFANDYLTYDMLLNKVVTLDQVVNDMNALRPIILDAITEQLGYTSENLFLPEDGLPPAPSSFYFEDGALHAVYQPYEIASFAQGSIDVTIYPYMVENKTNLIYPYGYMLMEASKFIDMY